MAQNYITEVMNKNTLYKIKDEESRTIIGDLDVLSTNEKADIVSAINEVKESGNEIIAQTEAPADIKKIWLDTDDNSVGNAIAIDKTLTKSGKAADAKTVGDEINKYKTAVLFTPQELTEEEKKQARQNIGADSGTGAPLQPLTFTGASTAEYDGTKPVTVDIETAYPISEESASTLELTPNVYHKWGEMATLSITLGAETPGVVSEFCGEFVSGVSPTNLSVPGDIKWISELKIEASKKYQFSIVDGIGVIAGA